MRIGKPVRAIWGFIYAYAAGVLVLVSFDERTTVNPALAAALLFGPAAAVFFAFRNTAPPAVTQRRHWMIAAGYLALLALAALFLALARHLALNNLTIALTLSGLLALGLMLGLRLPEKPACLAGAPVAALFALTLAGGIVRLAMRGAENDMLWLLLAPAALLLLLWYLRKRRA